MASVNWWLDFKEHWEDNSNESMEENIFWVGPFTWDVGEVLSIQAFVDEINQALTDRVTTDPTDLFHTDPCSSAFPTGCTGIHYRVRPRLRLVGTGGAWSGVESIGAPMAGTAISTTATDLDAYGYGGIQELLDLQAAGTAGVDLGHLADLYYGLINGARLGGNDRFVIRYDLEIIDRTIEPIDDGAGGGFVLYNTEIQARHGMHGAGQPAGNALDDGGGCPGTDPAGHLIVPKAQVHFTNASSTALTLVSSTSAATVMLDNPPLPPNLSIFPYMGVNNRLLFMFNSNTGKYVARPEILKASDANAISDLFLHQYGTYIPPTDILDPDVVVTDGIAEGVRLLYENDDPIGRYELFRIDTRPETYLDYDTGNNPHKTVGSHVFVNKDSSAASYIDEILPNKKYYYCARAIDVHNNFSNPTHVFEVELVDNDGQTYLILNTIMLGSSQAHPTTKPGRRYLYIEPALVNLGVDRTSLEASYSSATVQTVPAQNLLGDGANPSEAWAMSSHSTPPASLTEGPIWDKTFKVRITSKKTYKKIDLNIKFKNTGVDNP